MNKKNSILTIVLVLATLVLGGLSFYIGIQLNQPSEEITQQETKPADVAFKKDIQFNQLSPTTTRGSGVGIYNEDGSLKISPTLTASPTALLAKNSTNSAGITSKLTPTKTLFSMNLSATPTDSRLASDTSDTITPTGINVVTTPIITSTLARTLLTGTVSPSRTVSETTRPTVNSLPSAGMFNTTLIIFAAAISMIFFSFLL